jgi:hypothetical protein
VGDGFGAGETTGGLDGGGVGEGFGAGDTTGGLTAEEWGRLRRRRHNRGLDGGGGDGFGAGEKLAWRRRSRGRLRRERDNRGLTAEWVGTHGGSLHRGFLGAGLVNFYFCFLF